jgi:hypothetical protein
MTAKWSRPIGSLATLALASAMAVAQEPPPKQDPPPEEKQETKEVELPIRWSSISAGYATWDGNGSRKRLFQYGTPPNGLTLYELNALSPWVPSRAFARLLWRGNPDQDTAGQGQLIFNQGNTMVRGRLSHTTYYDPTYLPVNDSDDRIVRVVAEQTLRPDVGAFYAYRGDQRAQRFPAPLVERSNRSNLHGVGIQGRVLGGQAGLTFTDHRFMDYSGTQPTTLQRGLSGHLGKEFGALSLEGIASYTTIEQQGRKDSQVKSLALAGTWDLGPLTSLQFNVARDDLDLNAVQNAYVRQRFNTGVRLRQRLGKWSAQLGYRHREAERVRADHSFVDVPKWNTFDARLSGRLTNLLRLTLRGSWEDLADSALMNTVDTRQLFCGDRALVQAKVDGGNDRFNGYASYTYRYRKNDARGVDVRWTNLSLGSSYSIRPDLLGYAELAYDMFTARGVTEANGENLNFYFPDSTSLGLGLDWTRSPIDSISASLNFTGSNNARATQLTMQYRRQISADHSLELVVAPWNYEDRLYRLTGYNTTLMQVRYTVRY